MPLNIPNTNAPGVGFLQGIGTGSNMFANLMNPIISRERMAQQKKLAEAYNAQQAKQHMDNIGLQQQNFGLRQQADARAASMLPFQIQSYQDAHVKSDPNFQMNQLKKMYSEFGGGDGKIDMDVIKNSPILRGYFKSNFGIDPAAEENRPLQGPARNAKDLERLRVSEGENSQVYRDAKNEHDANMQAKKDLSLVRDRTLSGLKSGERWINDPDSNERIGIEHNLTEKERNREIGRSFFNELYPVVYNGSSPFSGAGSIRKLEDAASKYNSDPAARKLFDDFLLSQKALTATTVNEAATLDSGKTNQTYRQLRESLGSSDIPPMINKLINQYKIPAEAQLKASIRFQKLINDAQNKANKMTPATRKLYFDPEKHMNAEESSQPKGAQEKYKDEEMVTVEGPNGQETMTYAQAKKLGAK